MLDLRLSLIVPTYNAAENPPRFIERAENSLEGIGHEITIVVDNNTPDCTGELAEKIARRYLNLRTLGWRA